jgi:hypothetical protein
MEDGPMMAEARSGPSVLRNWFPENHLLRRINVFVTVALEDLRKELSKSVRTLGTIEHQ